MADGVRTIIMDGFEEEPPARSVVSANAVIAAGGAPAPIAAPTAPAPAPAPAAPVSTPTPAAAAPAPEGLPFLGGLTDAEIEEARRYISEYGQTANRALSFSQPLSKEQLTYVEGKRALLKSAAPAQAAAPAAPPVAAAPLTPVKNPMGTPPAAPPASVVPAAAPSAAGASPSAPSEDPKIAALQADLAAAQKTAREANEKADALLKEKRIEAVRRQRVELHEEARKAGVPEDLLDDAWNNALGLRKTEPAMRNARVNVLVTRLRTVKPSLFRGTAVPPTPAPVVTPARPRATPTPRDTGQAPPPVAAPVKTPPREANSLSDAAANMKAAGRAMFGNE